MNAKEQLEAIEALLIEERLAIRSMSSANVLALAERKGQMFNDFLQVSPEERKAVQKDFERIVASLQRNCILVAHARDCVRDAVEILQNARMPTSRLSVTG